MDKESLLLIKLLDEPSFVAWLRGFASATENERWRQWLTESKSNKIVAEKARKLVSMPLKEVKVELREILDELEKLKDQLPRLHLI